MIKKIISKIKYKFTDPTYCPKCKSCGADGCCSALKCAYQKMIKDGDGLNCEIYYKDLEFAYEMFHELYDKYSDKEIFNRVWDKVYKKSKVEE